MYDQQSVMVARPGNVFEISTCCPHLRLPRHFNDQLLRNHKGCNTTAPITINAHAKHVWEVLVFFYVFTLIKGKMKSIAVLHNANRKTQFCGLTKVFCYKSSRSSPRPPQEAQGTRDNPKNLTQPRQPHAAPETRTPPEVPCTPNIPYNPKQPQDRRRQQATPGNSIKTKNKHRKISQESKKNNLVLKRSQCLRLAPIRKACESKLYARASICQCLRPGQATGTII